MKDIDSWTFAAWSVPLLIAAGVGLLVLQFRSRRRWQVVLHAVVLIGFAGAGTFAFMGASVLLHIFLEDITGNEVRWSRDHLLPIIPVAGTVAGMELGFVICRHVQPAAFRRDSEHTADYGEGGRRSGSSPDQ